MEVAVSWCLGSVLVAVSSLPVLAFGAIAFWVSSSGLCLFRLFTAAVRVARQDDLRGDPPLDIHPGAHHSRATVEQLL